MICINLGITLGIKLGFITVVYVEYVHNFDLG